MKVCFVSTTQFWERMCDVASVRTSRLTLANRDNLLVTLEAPEDVPGFMEARIEDIRSALGLDTPSLIQRIARKLRVIP